MVVEESKRFGLELDSRDKDDRGQARTPHGQILRYLATADIASESAIRWGILTNGRTWRLYDYRARPRATGYYEADLATILQPERETDLRTFFLLFRRDSFIRQAGATRTFLEDALAEGRRYEERVAQDLSGVVFERVFPQPAPGVGRRRGGRGGPGASARGGPDLSLSPAVRTLRRGPRPAAGQRRAVRRLRLAATGPRGHCPPDAAKRRLFEPRHRLLRQAAEPVAHD